MSEATEHLVLRYFESWQEPADFESLRETLASDVVFDAGGETVEGADRLTSMVQDAESPWKEVTFVGIDIRRGCSGVVL